jgi:PIN domain nuclease of toxin-antitoxin system
MPTPYLAPTLKDQGYTGATGTTPYKPATTQQVDTLQGLYNNSPVANAPQVVSATATVININFDGTKNNGQFPAPGESPTNISQLTDLQIQANGEKNTIYLPGVGAQTVPAGTLDANGNPAPGSSPSNWDSIPFNAGDVANGIVDQAYKRLTTRISAILAEDPNAEISLNLSGFSRGGAEAVAFANLVNERGIPGLYEAGQVPIDSMVLFDPVSQTNGQLNTSWPTNVKSALVMVAENEGRAIMPAMPVGGNAEVVLVPGAHADVGGSFNPDGVSAVTLKMARDFQEQSGVPVAEIPDSLAPNWEQMNIHNSGLDNYDKTVWSFNENYRGYEGAGFGSPSVADVIRNGVPYVPSADNPAAGDALDYKVPADPSQPDGVQLTVREVTDRHGNSTLTVMDADGHVVMTAAPGDVLVREPSTGQFTLTNGVDGQTSTYTPEAAIPEMPVTPDAQQVNDALVDAFSNPQVPADKGVQVADDSGALPDTFADTSTPASTNTFSNFLDTQGGSLSPAQQTALATQIDSLGLGGEADLSFYSLPGGGALIANADGDIVGEINRSASGSLNLKATGIDAQGNTVDINQHISPEGESLNQTQYNAQTQAQANASVNLFNSLMAAQQWDQLNDMGKLAVLANVYSAVDTLGGELPGDLGGLASVLSLMQGLDSGNDLLVLRSGLQLGQMGLDAYSDYMADLAMQMADELMTSTAVDAASSAAMDAAAEAALESAAASNTAGQAVPYVSYVMALQNFEDHPEQAIGTMAGTYVGTAIGAVFGPVGAAIGGAIGGMIGGMVGGLFGDDDMPMREGLAHAQWDASGHTQVVTTQDAEGGGATANSWMSSLVNSLQTNLDQHTDANGQPQYGLVPNLLPSVGFKYDPDGFNLANGARGFMYLEWTDEQGQTQTRYYDGAGNRGDGSGETLVGDFMQHAQGAIAPAWQVQTTLAHYQHSGEIDLPKQSSSLPTELADGLHQTLQVVSLTLPNTLPTEVSLSSKLVDVDGDGYLEQTQWLQSNQAVLAVDLNGDGQISVGETVNLQDAGQGDHPRTSMQWLDANGDHRLDASDPAFAALKLWVDINSDSKSASGELQTLAQANITAIDFSTNPPSIERADGSTQELTVQTLTADTLGVAYQVTEGGVVETTEQLDGTGTSVLHAVNTREFDGQAAHTQGGGQDVDGSSGEVMQVDASQLATTTHNTIANSSRQTSTTVGVGDSRLRSAAPPTATVSTTTTNNTNNNANNARVVFVPTGQTSVQQEIQLVTDSMIESAQSSLFGLNAGNSLGGLGVLTAVSMGATVSAAEAAEATQRAVVVSDARSSYSGSTSNPVNTVSSGNTFTTTASTTPTATSASADVSSGGGSFTQVNLGGSALSTQPSSSGSSTASTSSTTPVANVGSIGATTTEPVFVYATVITSSNSTNTIGSNSTTPASPVSSVSASASTPADVSPVASPLSLAYPQVQAENLSGTEDVVLRLTQSVLLANDSTVNASADPNAPALTITAVSAPLHGQVSLVNGEVLFTPETNFNGTASFTYTVTDQYGLSTNSSATLQIAPVNDAPDVVADTLSATEDTPKTVTQADLLANDSDVDNPHTDLRIVGVSNATHGSVSLNADGSISFNPALDYFGAATFNYTVGDGAGGFSVGTATVNIAPVNDAPVAVGESLTLNEDEIATLSVAALLANDTDVDNTHTDLSIQSVGNATHGSVSLVTTNGVSSVVFEPELNFNGTASFTYTVSDGVGGTATTSVSLDFTPVNDAPVVNNELYMGKRNVSYSVSAAALLANDSDVETATANLNLASVGNAQHGTVSLVNGNVVFVPETGYAGRGSFDYVVQDADGGQTTGTTQIDFSHVNVNPIAVDDSLSGFEDVPFSITQAQLLVNDSDSDNASSSLRVTSLGGATHGTVGFDAQGNVVFTPASNFYGQASFTYQVSDGDGGSTWATASLSVASVNDAPIIEDIWYGRPIYGYQVVTGRDSEGNAYTVYDRVTSAATAASVIGSGAQLYLQQINQASDGEGGIYNVTSYHAYTPTYYRNGDMRPVAFDNNDATQSWSDEYSSGTSLVNDAYRQNGGVVAYDPDGDSHAVTFSIGSTPQHGHAWVNEYTNATAPDQLDHTQVDPYMVAATGAWQYYSTRGDTYSGADGFQVSVTDSAGASTSITVNATHTGSSPAGGGGKKPVTLDLNGDGLQYIGLDDSKAYFDVNDDGWRERMAWVGAGDGLLALDTQGDHAIDKWNEISFVSYKEGAQTDLEGLQAFDSSGNGQLDRLDARWHEFGVWIDANANGACETGEFKTLDDLGIASINLISDHQVTTPVHGVTELGQSSFTTVDGKTHAVGDVAFEVDTTHTLPAVTHAGVAHEVTTVVPEATSQMTAADMQLAEVIRQALLFNQMVNTASSTNEPPLSFVSNELLTQDWVQPELHALVDAHATTGVRTS